MKPDSLEKEVRLQLPVTIASYPYRSRDGRRGGQYPDTLPMLRSPATGDRTAP